MKKANLTFLLIAILTFGIILGFSINDKNPSDKNPNESRNRNNSNLKSVKDLKNLQLDNNGISNKTFGSPYYTDHFDGANDTASLKSRGYKVYRNGTFSGTPSTNFWFTGNTGVFAPQTGAGYLGSDFQSAGEAGNIDNWLVLPQKNILTGDSLFFGSRSPIGSTYPDSIRVLYSASGDSTTSGTFTELSRFKTTTAGVWERRGFRAPSAGANARFVIRYSVVNGGLNGSNSDYIGIDELTIETTPFAADVGVQFINAPGASTVLPSFAFTPNVTVKNFGTISQSFNVTMTISPGGYSNTQTVSGLASGASQGVNFLSYTPAAGIYTVLAYTQLASDGNRSNDTLIKTYRVYNPNFGGTSGFNASSYFYANSTPGASGAASQPGYCRMDTSGGTTLVSNSTQIVAPTRGDLDDGHWLVYRPGGPTRKVKFDGVVYDSIFIGTNGIIGLTNFVPDAGNWNPPAGGLPGNGSGGVSRPAVYPLWNDLQWDNLTQPDNRLSWKVDGSKNQFIVTYDKSPLFAGGATDWATFQVAIGLQLDTAGAPNSNIVINFSNTTTNFNLPALIGLQNSSGSSWAQYFFMNASAVLITKGPVPVVDTTIAGGGVAIAYGPNVSNLLGNCKELRLKALVEGYWSGTNIPDTMRAEIRSSVSPYNVIDVQYARSDAAGNYSVDVSNVNNGVSYYLTTRNRNSIETWSKLPQTWTVMVLNYDFTTAANKAFGDNQTFKAGKWTIYSGDVNQDGTVDGSDGALVDNDAFNFVSGYVPSDLNGDSIVDGSDAAIVDNNASNFVSVARP